MTATTDEKKVETFGTRTRVGGSRTVGKDGKVTVNRVPNPKTVKKDKDNAD